MKVFKLIFKNALRHKLRSFLTILGISIAVMAFGLLRTLVGAWNAGVDLSAANRLIVRHSVSFIFPLPIAYLDKIRNIEGVSNVSHATWYQGIYKEQSFKNFFPRMAIDPDNYFNVYPEFVISPDQLEAFRKERNSCIIGRETAKLFGLKIGDVIPVEGDIYPGKMEFVIRGIYTSRDKSYDETQMLFQWKYLDEFLVQTTPGRAGHIGWYVVEVAKPSESARISAAIDAMFKNSQAETRTETEKAFQQGFVSMSGAILTAMDFISFVIIGIILLVLANTMAMTARERITEYAVLKTLGFTSWHLVGLITGESLFIASVGGAIGLAVTFPIADGFKNAFPTIFPVFAVSPQTIFLSGAAAIFVGIVASVIPTLRAVNMSIVNGLRQIG